MSGIAKGAKSKRKTHFNTDRAIATPRMTDVAFMHEASLGDEGFNLASLVLPSDSGTFQNPSASIIASLTQVGLRTNLELYNSQGKRLMPGLSYEVSGLQVTFIGFTAEEDEVFYGVIKNAPRNNLAFLDGTQVLAMGFLAVGQTDFNVGQQFKWNHNGGQQVGAIRVERSRVPQYRNSDNLDDGLLDADYSEIRAGASAFSTMIKFNEPGALLPGNLLEFVVVYGTQVFVDRENGSLRSEMEVQAAQVLRLAETLAVVAGVPVTDFLNANPNQVQLKQFGDSVLDALKRILALETDLQTGVSVFRATDLSIPNSPAGTTLSWNGTEFLDGNGTWDGTTFTCQNPGKYLAGINCLYSMPTGTGYYINAIILRNGGIVGNFYNDGTLPSVTTVPQVGGCRPIRLESGDQVVFQTRQENTGGVSRTLAGAAAPHGGNTNAYIIRTGN